MIETNEKIKTTVLTLEKLKSYHNTQGFIDDLGSTNKNVRIIVVDENHSVLHTETHRINRIMELNNERAELINSFL